MSIVGREAEMRVLEKCLISKKPEFVAVFGRFGVGKTYLIREYFKDTFCFHLTGTTEQSLKTQLGYFNAAMNSYSGGKTVPKPARSWQEAFLSLIDLLEKTTVRHQGKRVVFFDELAWLDTPRSGFLSALEHFWNDWGSTQPDLILIICGSASSWIINKVLKSRGGLHNRVTRRIRLEQFTLSECDSFFRDSGLDYDKTSVAQSYMVFGGIPYYLNLFDNELSVTQNIDRLCFETGAPLKNEFDELYAALFKNADKHILIIRALAKVRKGLTRNELIAHTKLPSGGGLTTLLEELEESGFIRCYEDFSRQASRYLYQLTDFFSLFYLAYMQDARNKAPRFWEAFQGSSSFANWQGYSFELLCLTHIAEIKGRLGISGIMTNTWSWRDPEPGSNLQIDLVIERNDNTIDLCEMKYTKQPFAIDKAYRQRLQDRRDAFVERTRTDKSVRLVMISSKGIKPNSHSHIIQRSLVLEDLWERK